MERIAGTWRRAEKRQCGIGEMEGWRDIRWREDRGLWLVWFRPRVRLVVSIRRIMMPMKRRHPRRPVLSVLAQVGTSRHILPTFLVDNPCCVFQAVICIQSHHFLNFRVRFTFPVWHFKHRWRKLKGVGELRCTSTVQFSEIPGPWITRNQQPSSSASLPSWTMLQMKLPGILFSRLGALRTRRRSSSNPEILARRKRVIHFYNQRCGKRNICNLKIFIEVQNKTKQKKNPLLTKYLMKHICNTIIIN